MSYAQAYTDATTPTVLQRFQESVCNAAVAIVNEATNTPNHVARAAFAKQVLQNPSGWAANMAFAITADGVTGAGSTDAQIDVRVASVWNCFI